MMKFTFFLVVFLEAANSFSQISHSISLGPDLGVPTQSFGKANLGFGGSFQYQLKFSLPVGVQLHVGYSSFTNKLSADDKVSFLPVRLGGVYYLYENVIFISADAGISKYHAKFTGTDLNGFSFGAGAGYRYPVGIGQFMQISAYYNMNKFKEETSSHYFKYNWFNIRAAYGLSWGKGKKTADPHL